MSVRLTVVTATFNVLGTSGADALERCIRSVAPLSAEHEHLVIDGASTDGTLERLQALAAGIPSLRIVSEPDEGIYDALNKGLVAARGNYFYVLGADDFIDAPNEFVTALEKVEATGADVYITRTRFDNGRIFPKTRLGFYDMAFRMAYSHQGCLARTDLLRRLGGFDRTYRLMGDYKLMLAAHLAGARVITGTKPFCRFNSTGRSGTDQASAEIEDDRIRAEVEGFSAAELADYRQSSRLPLRVIRRFLASPSSFTRRLGWRALITLVWRKHKDERTSARYLCGLRIFRHLKKGLRT